MTFFLDSNVLLYAVDEDSPIKRDIAASILIRGHGLELTLANQVLGEFMSVVRRKHPSMIDGAIGLIEHWALFYPVILTSPAHLVSGMRIAARYRLQFWDSVILAIAHEQGADILLTEDMQDGATIDGVTILNPFRPENAARLERLLTA